MQLNLQSFAQRKQNLDSPSKFLSVIWQVENVSACLWCLQRGMGRQGVLIWPYWAHSFVFDAGCEGGHPNMVTKDHADKLRVKYIHNNTSMCLWSFINVWLYLLLWDGWIFFQHAVFHMRQINRVIYRQHISQNTDACIVKKHVIYAWLGNLQYLSSTENIYSFNVSVSKQSVTFHICHVLGLSPGWVFICSLVYTAISCSDFTLLCF